MPAATTSVTKLNAAVDQLRELDEKLSGFVQVQEKQAKVNRFLRAKVDDLQEKLDLVTERIQFLEGVLELDDPVEQEMGVGGTAGDAGRDVGPSSDQDIPEGDASKVSGSVEEDTDGISVSQELAKGKVIKVPTIGFNMGVRY
jgi:hypothetical protein